MSDNYVKELEEVIRILGDKVKEYEAGISGGKWTPEDIENTKEHLDSIRGKVRLFKKRLRKYEEEK